MNPSRYVEPFFNDFSQQNGTFHDFAAWQPFCSSGFSSPPYIPSAGQEFQELTPPNYPNVSESIPSFEEILPNFSDEEFGALVSAVKAEESRRRALLPSLMSLSITGKPKKSSDLKNFERAYRDVPCNPDASFLYARPYIHGMAKHFCGLF